MRHSETFTAEPNSTTPASSFSSHPMEPDMQAQFGLSIFPNYCIYFYVSTYLNEYSYYLKCPFLPSIFHQANVSLNKAKTNIISTLELLSLFHLFPSIQQKLLHSYSHFNSTLFYLRWCWNHEWECWLQSQVSSEFEYETASINDFCNLEQVPKIPHVSVFFYLK